MSIDWKKVTDGMTDTKGLFNKPAEDAKTTRLSHALRKLNIDDEIMAKKRDILAMNLDRTVVLMNVKGSDIERLGAYVSAKRFYEHERGKVWVQP